MNNTVSTFIATFAGVIASFVLWFLGELFFKWIKNKKARISMVNEMLDEMQFNLLILTTEENTTKDMIEKQTTPTNLPRLRLESVRFAISSGDIRLVDKKNQTLLRLYLASGEEYNHFTEITETLVITFMSIPNGLGFAKLRIQGQLSQTQDEYQSLTKTYETLLRFSQTKKKSFQLL